MRKSFELDFEPYPLSGMARYSPGCRPSTIDEKPWTGCKGSGKVIPLTTPGGRNVPLTGPAAYVSTGSTARPTRATCDGPSAPAEASTAAAATTPKHAATVAMV